MYRTDSFPTFIPKIKLIRIEKWNLQGALVQVVTERPNFLRRSFGTGIALVAVDEK